MKKILFLTATALGIASQAFALNPTNSFYVPKKGNFLFRGDASWQRIQDKTGTDTYTSIDGMYGLTNGVALIAGVYENPYLLNYVNSFSQSMKASRIPEIGIRFAPTLDNGLRVAAEAAYGVGVYGSDTNKHDYIRTKLTAGVDIGHFIFGAFADYTHYYRFAKNVPEYEWVNIHNADFYGGGLIGTYILNDKTSLDLTWRHTFKEQVDIRYRYRSRVKGNYKDAIKVSATYEFRDGAYVTPYIGYDWMDKAYSRGLGPRNTTTFGVNVAVEF